MTATFFPDRWSGGSGWIHPISKAWSIMAHSMFLMVTGGELMPRTQAPYIKNTQFINYKQKPPKEKKNNLKLINRTLKAKTKNLSIINRSPLKKSVPYLL